MEVYACVIVKSESDIKQLLEHDPDHWIEEALKSYSIEDFSKMVVPIENTQEGKFVSRDITNTPRIIDARELPVAVYMGSSDGGRLYASDIRVPVFEFDGENGLWFWISNEQLEDGALS